MPRSRSWCALLFLALVFVFSSCTTATPSSQPLVPIVDHHQHVGSPTVEKVLAAEGSSFKTITAADVLALLDEAGIRRATVISAAYMLGKPGRIVDNKPNAVRAENDWTAAQVALHPDRLRGICSINPMEDYALAEIARCAANPHLRTGLKMHIGNSDVQLEVPEHVEQLRKVFRLANENKMALVIHLRASFSKKRPYGSEQARVFLEELLPLVPDVPVQIAHLAASGPGYADAPGDAAMAYLAEAIANRDPRTRNLYFDIAGLMKADLSPEEAEAMVKRIRQAGPTRILYGTDAAGTGNPRPAEAWTAFRKLPLTEQEFATIARNVAPYWR